MPCLATFSPLLPQPESRCARQGNKAKKPKLV